MPGQTQGGCGRRTLLEAGAAAHHAPALHKAEQGSARGGRVHGLPLTKGGSEANTHWTNLQK